MSINDDFDEAGLESQEGVTRLNKDLREAAATLSYDEARFLVDEYYITQKNRIREDAQVRALTAAKEPNRLIDWFGNQSRFLEGQLKAALDRYTRVHPAAKWARSVKGVGPVIAAGLVAHIDIHKAATASQIWSFAGLNPTAVWAKGQKRPWNAKLKTLCWKLGMSFIKVSNREDAVYGKVYRERKDYEIARNDRGENADKAANVLATRKVDTSTDAYKWLAGCYPLGTQALLAKMLPSPATDRANHLASVLAAPGTYPGMLPVGQIDARARRYAVKRFLAHFHEVWRKQEGLSVQPPYPIAHLGHAHKVEPPNFDDGKAA